MISNEQKQELGKIAAEMRNLSYINNAVRIYQILKIGNSFLLNILYLINICSLYVRHSFGLTFNCDNILTGPAGRPDSNDQKDNNADHSDSCAAKNSNCYFPQPAVIFPTIFITCQICYLFIILILSRDLSSSTDPQSQ